MPSYTRGKLRNNGVFVKTTLVQPIYTFFNTKDLAALPGLSGADLEGTLGHLSAAPSGALVIVRASSPKPPRVTKTINARPNAAQQGKASTFCAIDKLNDALAGGWQLSKKRLATLISNNSRTVTAMAQLSNGLYYALSMNANDFTTYGEQLGLKDGTTVNTPQEREKVVRGSSRPSPGYAKKALTSGDITKPFSTGTDVAKEGWEIMEDEQL